MPAQFPVDIHAIAGFLAEDEAQALHQYALQASPLGPALEIGSYCGKSTICLGSACHSTGSTVYALDHHRGSEEHQPGEAYHDPALVDEADGEVNTFLAFRRNIRAAGLEQTVVPLVSDSETASRDWRTPLGLVFIDGGHSLDAALTDYRCWSGHLLRGGLLLIHDIFKDAAEGGQAPVTVLRLALASGLYEQLAQVNTLAVLRRL